MRYIVIILIVFPFNKPSFGQNYDISEIFAGIKMFFTQNEIKSYIDKNEFYEMLPDNESKYYFVKFDSTEMAYAKYQLIDTIGKVFYTLNSEDFFLLGVNRWFEITNFHCSKNLMKFNFRTLSYRKLMNIKYINGYVELIKRGESWYKKKLKSKKYDYPMKDVINYCKDKTINCHNIKTNEIYDSTNFLNGDWQTIINDDYVEISFNRDTFYMYSYLLKGMSYKLNYKIIADTVLVLDFESKDSSNYWIIIKIDADKVDFIIKNFNENFEIVPQVITASKLPDIAFKLNDVRCWGRAAEGFRCYIESDDEKKYYKSFIERANKYYIKE